MYIVSAPARVILADLLCRIYSVNTVGFALPTSVYQALKLAALRHKMCSRNSVQYDYDFYVRRHASEVGLYDVVVCLSVCLP